MPVYGAVKKIELDEDAAVTVEIATEREFLLTRAPPATRNATTSTSTVASSALRPMRAGLATQAEGRQPEFSRDGLALTRPVRGARSVHRARGGPSVRTAGGLYEFHYQPVANAFARAVEAGADVRIVYDAHSAYKVENEAVIRDAGLDQNGAVIPRTVSKGLRHNKFIVLLKDDRPIGVWTGSTNISGGGLFGHSNVGHIVWSATIAKMYLDYRKLLAANLKPGKLRSKNQALSPLPAGRPAPNSITPVFSARDAADSSVSLQWYADRMAEAQQIVCFTVAFNIDKVFQEVIARENDVLRYIVKDDDLGESEIIGRDRDVLFAAGGYLGERALANFLAERSNPLNRNDYIHDKFMLVDPLGDDPLVVTGSANCSQPSQRRNDENMLAIRGDTRVADIYFGEFMRIFDHPHARYLVRKLTEGDQQDPNAGYLKINPKNDRRPTSTSAATSSSDASISSDGLIKESVLSP